MSAQLDALTAAVTLNTSLVTDLIAAHANGTPDAALQPAIDSLTASNAALTAALGR